MGGLYYDIKDLSINGGLGQVIQKNVPVTHRRIGDCVNAVKHGNGRDWWIITKRSGPNPITHFNRFITYLLTPNGIADSITQDFNNATDIDSQKMFWKNASCDTFMHINIGGLMAEMKIDRCTGIIDTIRTIFPEQTGNYNRFFFMGSYSPNGNIFYVSRNPTGFVGDKNYLLQYDLTASDIPASCDTLDSAYTWPPVDNGALKLGLDGKIYYASKYASSVVIDYPYADSMRYFINENLGVINNPDVMGSGCNFAPFSFYLGGKRTYYGLPNNPNYELGRLVGSLCDTITVITPSHSQEEVNKNLLLYYHHDMQTLYVNAQNLKGKYCTLKIYDMQGKIIYASSKGIQPPFFTEDVSCIMFAEGMYVLRLETEKEVMSKKFVRE